MRCCISTLSAPADQQVSREALALPDCKPLTHPDRVELHPKESILSPMLHAPAAAGQIGQNFNIKEVWSTLEEHMASKTPVKGRVLNATNGGYTIGFGGITAFCPFTRCSVLTASRIGILQPFIVESMDPDRNNVVLTDHRIKVLESRRLQSRRTSFDSDDPRELGSD